MHAERNTILIVGAGGLARQLVDDLVQSGLQPAFYEDPDAVTAAAWFEQWGCKRALTPQGFDKCLIAVSGPTTRDQLTSRFASLGLQPVGFVSSRVRVPPTVAIEDNSIILQECLLEPYAKVGFGSLLNAGVFFHHDSACGRFCELAPRVTVLGGVHIGNHTFVGAGAVIRGKIRIGSNVVIGCGSVVVDDVPDNETWCGNPARPIRRQ